MRHTFVLVAAAWVAVGLGLGACDADVSNGLGMQEDCQNGVDDDGDGATDCADADCHGHAYCLEYHEYTCGNGADDDGDGLVDCDDPDCTQTQECDPDHEWACLDGQDNDDDGLTDCADPDCEGACEEVCDDGVDNDGDGSVDCADSDCAWLDACVSGEELCRNGVDDDGDGLADCEDPDCADSQACVLLEICIQNGVDEDGDGLADCADPDCFESPYCLELLCDDGQDNDGDGLIDCDDHLDCDGLTGCVPSTSCEPAEPVLCGDLISDSTAGRLDNFGSYPCLAEASPGGERYYLLQRTPGQAVIVGLYNLSSGEDLQLVVTSSTGQVAGCDPGAPCAVATGDPIADQEVILDGNSGSNVWIIVDSATLDGGPFDLEITCFTEHELVCDDGLDDDLDGDVDCMDTDCISDAICSSYWVDAGIECQSSGECAPSPQHFCLQPPGIPGMNGFCSRDCSPVGTLGGICDTGDPSMPGYCFPDDGGGSVGFCAYPCGPGFPGHVCPATWICINPETGSTTGVYLGACVPSP